VRFGAALLLALGTAGSPAFAQFHVPEGFVVERPSALAGSLLTLTFAPDGSAYIGRESEGIVRLVDKDGDTNYEVVEEFADELRAVQGLLVHEGALLACGMRGGDVGIWSVAIGPDGKRAGLSERLYAFTDGGEHGPHALVRAPDGAVYVMVGNHAAFSDAAGRTEGFWAGDEGRLLPPYMDPLGHGTHVRYPGGFVARLDLEKRTWAYVAVGLRNAYDMAFDHKGSPYAVDSDMEWDIGLPWYRPVRVLEIVEGADYGSRAGSSAIPSWCLDTQPALFDLGRGSPSGAVFGTHTRFPNKWRWALFSGDWAQGRIQAIWSGAYDQGPDASCVDFLTSDGALPVTDVEVGPEGGLWFLSGGRGAQGGVFRVVDPTGESRAMSNDSRLDTLRRSFAEQAVLDIQQGQLTSLPELSKDATFPFDRELWPIQLRIDAALAREEEIEFRSRLVDFMFRMEALFLMNRPPRAPQRSERLVRHALNLLDDLEREPQPNEELWLAVLRGLELGLLRQGDPDAKTCDELVERLLDGFPDDDPRASQQRAVLLAHFDDARALQPILTAMRASSQAEAIHYADCAHRFTRGWTPTLRREMLEWFERANAYEGGLSLRGYLAAMRASFIAAAPTEDCAKLAREAELGADALALLLARLPASEIEAMFPRFAAALAQLAPKSFGTPEQARKDAALRSLIDVRLPALTELARRLAREQGDILEAPWTLLARDADPLDWELWLAAIVSPSREKRSAARKALAQLELRPADAQAWRALLDHARELGFPRARELAETLASWSASAGATGIASASEFQAALGALEASFRSKFPEGPGPSEVASTPRWSEEAQLAFLQRSAARPGSAAHGRIVFESAGCAVCHSVGETPASDAEGFGPDLAHVSDRLSTADLLAAIVAPSRVISDQYRTFIALTNDERQFEGIVMRRDAQGILLKPVGAAAIEIEAAELESLEPSPRSAMPEGVMDSRTLEELRDLFAYLAAGQGRKIENPWSAVFGPDGLKGWTGDSSVWTQRGNTLVGRSNGLSQSSYLLAPMPAQDLLVEFDVFLPPGGNSGLCYRAERPLDSALSDPSGLQADLGQSYWGSLYEAQRGLIAGPQPEELAAALDRGGWNHVLVRFEGAQHSMEINGLQTYSLRADSTPGSLLGFQVHQGKPMQVRFANARWRRP